MAGSRSKEFLEAVRIGRPPNIQKLFPNSLGLLVSAKAVDRACLKKGKCMALAANGRSHIIIRGVLAAAKRANAAVIVEIAKSEGGATSYCATNYWNMARQVDQILNELSAEIPVAIHADHYGVKSVRDVEI
ncbi:MAG: class II fructose-bisphosphate aldolase, partial [Pseudomonadota bacterium]